MHIRQVDWSKAMIRLSAMRNLAGTMWSKGLVGILIPAVLYIFFGSGSILSRVLIAGVCIFVTYLLVRLVVKRFDNSADSSTA